MRAPVRLSILRRITWFGGDRRIVGGSALLLFLVGVIMFRGFGLDYGLPIFLPLMFWMGVLWLAREMNKADPYMVDVVLRQFKYRKYYAPKADLGVEHPQIRDYF